MKRFNTTGTCIPEQHCMADTSANFSQKYYGDLWPKYVYKVCLANREKLW
ncbi:MAG TPA: hypothetical protein VHY08_22515 [Bacillota bacterium]|nr:hypothetical protein [Bacillota bacterium]